MVEELQKINSHDATGHYRSDLFVIFSLHVWLYDIDLVCLCALVDTDASHPSLNDMSTVQKNGGRRPG